MSTAGRPAVGRWWQAMVIWCARRAGSYQRPGPPVDSAKLTAPLRYCPRPADQQCCHDHQNPPHWVGPYWSTGVRQEMGDIHKGGGDGLGDKAVLFLGVWLGRQQRCGGDRGLRRPGLAWGEVAA